MKEEEEKKINKDIGNKILFFRKSKNLTRTKMAEILNITHQQLDKYEKGLNRVSAAKLAIIAKKFKIDISYFYNDIFIENNKIKMNVNNELCTLISNYVNIKNNKIKNSILTLLDEFKKNNI